MQSDTLDKFWREIYGKNNDTRKEQFHDVCASFDYCSIVSSLWAVFWHHHRKLSPLCAGIDNLEYWTLNIYLIEPIATRDKIHQRFHLIVSKKRLGVWTSLVQTALLFKPWYNQIWERDILIWQFSWEPKPRIYETWERWSKEEKLICGPR